jgi:geranylgeranyl diphosphate synthase type II
MVGGQVVDVENNGKFLDEDTLFYVYKNKTSALIESSLMIGAVLAGASEEDIKKMEIVGENIGLAFQIEDDILDVTGDEKTIGKPVHSDEKNEKSTYIAMHGLEEGRKKTEEYTASGLEALQGVNAKDEEAASFLKELMLSLVDREK